MTVKRNATIRRWQSVLEEVNFRASLRNHPSRTLPPFFDTPHATPQAATVCRRWPAGNLPEEGQGGIAATERGDAKASREACGEGSGVPEGRRGGCASSDSHSQHPTSTMHRLYIQQSNAALHLKTYLSECSQGVEEGFTLTETCHFELPRFVPTMKMGGCRSVYRVCPA
eukprot:TRINITY_DN9914_c0_g1_i1.p1 TRINITY_DN9914_c0_g1~~TRINITY_DN9914_c0_g1_i1.p1  ORF type:complete len:181 (-),score=2.07 TRINITY_DN9914_c0_g1_i1:207-716(-)